MQYHAPRLRATFAAGWAAWAFVVVRGVAGVVRLLEAS
jgi:hypothetical protein